MDLDELEPRAARPVRKLEEMSLEELSERIAALEAEIARMREMMAAKNALRGAAKQLFRR
ncbi:MAG: DUF1192 domain-containing protein [Alphaproteobacteria bacterium]|nr:DUF1192 domain-containing protein [Alphaproteobacteria bacterium]